MNLGGGKGGADFDPKGKSDNEIRRFCEAFMRELSKHIGVDCDCPGGDIGVSSREIGWMFGQYRRMNKSWECVLTGKGVSWGGSLIRQEAAGFGVAYYVEQMIEYVSHGKESMAGKKVAISGSGNVAQYAARKVIQLGGIVCSLSDSKGAIVAMTGRAIDAEMIQITSEIKTMRKPLVDVSSTTAFKGKVRYLAAARPWLHVTDVDVALPCATQNELSGEEAVGLIKAGCKYVAERSNMGCTKEAVQVFELHRKEMKGNATWYAPGKAANAGGVAVSGLEMAQSCSRTFWTFDELDNKLKHIMKDCFDNGLNTAIKYMTVAEGELPSLVAGSNISGFVRVAKAMHDQGDWW